MLLNSWKTTTYAYNTYMYTCIHTCIHGRITSSCADWLHPRPLYRFFLTVPVNCQGTMTISLCSQRATCTRCTLLCLWMHHRATSARSSDCASCRTQWLWVGLVGSCALALWGIGCGGGVSEAWLFFSFQSTMAVQSAHWCSIWKLRWPKNQSFKKDCSTFRVPLSCFNAIHGKSRARELYEKECLQQLCDLPAMKPSPSLCQSLRPWQDG